MTLLNEREMKLLRLALDDSALEGEVDNAAVALISSLRVRKAKAEDFSRETSASPGGGSTKPKNGPDWGSVKFTFGKMKGRPIEEADPSYLLWCRDWIRSGDEDLETRYGNIAKAIDKFLGE